MRRVARAFALAGTLALASGLWPGALLAKTYALVIGIDEYQHIPPLQGAVNDARDIADALSSLPDSDVTALYNAEADRKTVLDTWRRLAAEAGPEDTIIVTYAGHGGNEPAAYAGTELDGKDEVLLLAGFDPHGPGGGERIRDDEIADLIALTPDSQVIMVADSCHSGTATRASRNDLAYRFYEVEGLEDDPLPLPPPPVPGARVLGAARNTVFFAAVADSEKAPEIPIDGQVRGALSYAFADGLRGAADRNTDGVVTKGELELYVRRFVRQATAGRQRPRVFPPGRRQLELATLTTATQVAATGPFDRSFAGLPPVAIRSAGEVDAGALLAQLDGVVVTAPEADDIHTILVDIGKRSISSMQGDRLNRLFGKSERGYLRQIQLTVDKMRGIQAIQAAQLSANLDVWFPLGDEIYLENDPVVLSIDGRSYPFVSILNLASDGTSEWLYPVLKEYYPTASIEDPMRYPPRAILELTVAVQPPFGSDHVIVIETPRRHDALHQVLANHNLDNDFRGLWDDLHDVLSRRTYNVAAHAFFTRRHNSR